MDEQKLRELLQQVLRKETTIDAAVNELKTLDYLDLGFAKLDTHRSLRCGFPEVIFCAGKTPEQILAIVQRLMNHGVNILATRLDAVQYAAITEQLPTKAKYHDAARVLTIVTCPIQQQDGLVAVVSAGTSDVPVAEEAALTLEVMGTPVERIYDVGVAGIHRLLSHQRRLLECRAVIVVAGMEGALPSVVAGLLDVPVIAVPTSVGYGVSFGGVAALLAMLNACASGITVVNIDNGFGAGHFASLINRMASQKK